MKHPLTRIQVAGIPPEGADITGKITAGELDIESDARIDFPISFDYKFTLSMVSGGLLSRGWIELRARCRCDRCLTYFDYSTSLVDLCYFIAVEVNDTVDLTDPIRQDILLSFPQQFLCRRECLGLCGNCGQNLNVRSCECRADEKPDSVWNELNKLFSSENEKEISDHKTPGDHYPD